MRINTISGSYTFKGQFEDKTSNGKWQMEYHPYSWELYHNTNCHQPYYDVRRPVMENKQKIDLLAPKLPDNEEIFTPMTKETPAISKDIFGTVSYYEYPVEVKLGEYRSKITEASPLNLEDSLNVYLRKNEIFRDMKQNEITKTKEELNKSLRELDSIIDACRSASYRSEGFHIFNDAADERVRVFNTLQMDTMPKHRRLIEKYVRLHESLEELNSFIAKMKSELKLIAASKSTGDVIDISVRHDHDANKALYEEGLRLINNSEKLQKTSKLVLLSHRTVELKEMILMYLKEHANDTNKLKWLPEGLTHIADRMITFRL